MAKKFLVVDGTAQLYRAFYAIKPLTDPQGRPVNVVFGFSQILLSLMEKLKPSHMVIVFDRPEPTHRHLAFPEYKAKREATPEELRTQIPLVKELIQAFHLTMCEQAGWEADDLIATLAKLAEKEKYDVFVYSSDKDLFQLVNEHIKVLRPMRGGKGEFEELDSVGVERVFGVKPGQVVDMLALMGDASDNIPGVPGIGEKTALELITTFGSLDQVYASLPNVSKVKVREKLETHRKAAEQSRGLVTIQINPELKLDWDACKVPDTLPPSAYASMAQFGFKRLLSTQSASLPEQPRSAWAEGLLSNPDVSAVVRAAHAQKKLAIEIIPQGIALAATPREAAVIQVEPGQLVSVLRRGGAWVDAVCDPAIAKVGYDLKPLCVALRQAGRTLQGTYEDLHLAAHLLDLPTTRPADFVSRILGGPPPEQQPELLACALLLIGASLGARLREAEAEKIYSDIELPLLPILAEMEAVGIAVDRTALETMAAEMGHEMDALEKEIQDMAGVEFNLRSPQQLAEVLFERLKLLPGKKTKTGHSTNVDVLEMLAETHPLPQKILDYRQLQKLKSTYLDVLPGLIRPEDGRVHTTFHQVGAITGRLSSSDPNLQNIPIRTPRGQLLRSMFVPGQAGNLLLSADYSQIELRLLAHLSQDEQMREDFMRGLDIHRATASDIFNVPIEEVTQEMRRQAKTSNFGIAYGVSPFGLARQLRIPMYKAKEFIDGFYTRYPQVRLYLDQIMVDAREKGYVSTFLGRRRYLPDIQSANRNVREAAERTAINTPIQGSAADIIKRAMIDIARELAAGAWQSRMILQVHDELLFEGPEKEMPKLREMVTQRMSSVYPLSVELVVEAAYGKSWMEAHE